MTEAKELSKLSNHRKANPQISKGIHIKLHLLAQCCFITIHQLSLFDDFLIPKNRRNLPIRHLSNEES